MNIYQRIILIAGAIALVAIFLTTPRYLPIRGNRFAFTAEMEKRNRSGVQICPVTDIRAVAARGGIAIGATLLVCFAASKRKGKKV